MSQIDISVCIITYKRLKMLAILLQSLAEQRFQGEKLTYEIIVVDNDKRGLANPVVRSFMNSNNSIPVKYEIEPIAGIPIARNRSVKLAEGQYIAFIDDDEKASPDWLEELYKCLIIFEADAVFGHVLPIYPGDCPDWIKKGKFFERPVFKDGAIVTSGRTSNALVRRKWFDRYAEPFDIRLRFTGGSDSDFFSRISQFGAKFCCAEKAIVYEFVDEKRLNMKWLLMRAFRGGQEHARQSFYKKSFLKKSGHLFYRFSLFLFALSMVPVMLPLGRDKSVWWLRKVFSNLGQFSIISSFKYQEYHPSNYR